VLDAGLLDLERVDEDADGLEGEPEDLLDGLVEAVADGEVALSAMARQSRLRAIRNEYKKRFKWIRPSLFKASLAQDLAQDTQTLTELLASQGAWAAENDHKWQALHRLLTHKHGKDKVLIFTQFADTARYLAREARKAGISHVAVATGASADPYALACRFSPKSNNKVVSKGRRSAGADLYRRVV
jgi:SNF2 family DNA or RNA helicase